MGLDMAMADGGACSSSLLAPSLGPLRLRDESNLLWRRPAAGERRLADIFAAAAAATAKKMDLLGDGDDGGE